MFHLCDCLRQTRYEPEVAVDAGSALECFLRLRSGVCGGEYPNRDEEDVSMADVSRSAPGVFKG